MGCWNIAGWGNGLNCKFRHDIIIIQTCNFDVVCSVETHLLVDSTIDITGVTIVSKRARRGSGGVGILLYYLRTPFQF